MKITKTRLKKIIKEELDIVLKEYLTMEDAPRYFAGKAIGALKAAREMSNRFATAKGYVKGQSFRKSELGKLEKEVGGSAGDYCREVGKEFYRIADQMSSAMAYKSGADFADFEPRLKEIGKKLTSASNAMMTAPEGGAKGFKKAVDQLSPEFDDLIKIGYKIIEANS